MSTNVKKLRTLIAANATTEITYAGARYGGCYQTVSVDGETIQGQRSPAQRLAGFRDDLTGKTVLDLGCNQGGMLFEIADRVQWGVGVDHNPGLINVALKTRDIVGAGHLSFFNHDLVKSPLEHLLCFFRSGESVDVVFMFAIARWVRNWAEVLRFLRPHHLALYFEAHGGGKEREQQHQALTEVYDYVDLLYKVEDDNNRRDMYRCC